MLYSEMLYQTIKKLVGYGSAKVVLVHLCLTAEGIG